MTKLESLQEAQQVLEVFVNENGSTGNSLVCNSCLQQVDCRLKPRSTCGSFKSLKKN